MTKPFLTPTLFTENATRRSPLGVDQYQRYTRHGQRLRHLRRIMPITALIAFTVVFFWPELMVLLDRDAHPEMDIDQKVDVRNRLSNPRFHSTDNNGRPYQITAQSAVQQTKEKVNLEAPHSKIQLEDGTTLNISAHAGMYDNETKKLDYHNDVQVISTTGYRLKTSLAHLDVTEKQAFGEQPVEGEGPTGKIVSEGFKATSEGIIHFTGKSHLTIPSKSAQVSQE